VESDCILGHEAAGIVLKVGEGVDELVVGEFRSLFPPFILSYCSISFSSLFSCFVSLYLPFFMWRIPVGKVAMLVARKMLEHDEMERARKAGGYGRDGESACSRKREEGTTEKSESRNN
jgi:hypothetical protein